ncbi:restriction endonuclease subunit S [Flavonifractor plautii]|uniref:restriction endonuclease subunit S n=1 Tax=Flavonifractor plautii TaxID=292800 RepID=UPI00189A4740|nr:restriction endonuclease subunit S [Flavonifractor plautii]
MADEVPFDIPDSWEWVRLGNISSYAETKQKVNATSADPSIWGLDLEDIEKGGRLLEYKTVGERKAVGDKTVFTKGDILYSKLRPYLLKILVAPDDGICTPEIVPFRVYGGIDPSYIVNYLKSPYVDNLINSITYGVKMPRVGTETMTSLLVPIPPLEEQRRIVEKIDEVASAVSAYDVAYQKNEALNSTFPETLKKSILQEAVQGKLVPQDPSDEPAEALLERIRAEKQRLVKEGKIKKDKHESVIFRRDNSHYEKRSSEEVCIDDEIPFEIPESWAWARLSSFGVFSSGKTPSMSNPQFWNGNVPWVTSKDMKRPVITDSEMHISELAAATMQLYPAGTLLLVARSGILKRLLPLCKLGIDSTINQDIKAFSLYDIELSEWLFYGIKAFEPFILKELVKSVTTVESLKFDEFAAMLIPVPPLSEQRRIIDAIKTAMNLLTPLSSNPLFSL